MNQETYKHVFYCSWVLLKLGCFCFIYKMVWFLILTNAWDPHQSVFVLWMYYPLLKVSVQISKIHELCTWKCHTAYEQNYDFFLNLASIRLQNFLHQEYFHDVIHIILLLWHIEWNYLRTNNSCYIYKEKFKIKKILKLYVDTPGHLLKVLP